MKRRRPLDINWPGAIAVFAIVGFWALVVSALMSVAGCAHAPLQEREVHVAASCVPAELGPAPDGLETRESLSAIPNGATRYVRLAADWSARVARMAETEPVVAACRTPTHGGPP